MKIKIELEGDSHEDRDEFNRIIHSVDMYSAILEARDLIRARLKHGEDVTDIEERTLESVREALFLVWED